MKDDSSNFKQHTSNKYLSPKAGITLVVLIVLWFGFSLPFLRAMGMDYTNSLYLRTICSYTMIILSIIFFTPNPSMLFRDHFTLWIIAISCVLPIFFGGEKVFYRGFLFILGIILIVYIILNRKTIKYPGIKSVFIGLAWSISAVLIIALIYALLIQTSTKPFPHDLLIILVNTFIHQLTFTTVPEEASFRGLVFSFLIINGYKEDKAFIIQAILFWGIHFGSIFTNPALFFIIIPLSTLFLTLIIRKYKFLYFSIMMHTLLNVFATILATAITRYFL